MACAKKPIGCWLQAPPSTANRVENCCASDITDSEADMWSVASDDDGAFRPRTDAAKLWHLLRKVHARPDEKGNLIHQPLEPQLQQPQLHEQKASPNRLQSAQKKMEEAVVCLREARMEVEEANEEERRTRLTEHNPELLTCYSRRIKELENENRELENENRELRCSLLKNNDIKATDCLPLPRFRAGHFQINGSDDEGEATGDKYHSLTDLFDINWDHVGSKNGSCASSRAPTRRPSPDSCNDVGSDVETTTEATTAAQPPTSPQLKGSNFSTAAHFLASARPIHKLSEEDAKPIWFQFARYESEIGYLRSVISTYEDSLCSNPGERHPQRPPSTTGRSLPLSSSNSVRRPRSANRFKEVTLKGETWSRAASVFQDAKRKKKSSRSCSFNSSASRKRQSVHHSAAVLLQANPDFPMGGLSSVSPLQPAPAA